MNFTRRGQSRSLALVLLMLGMVIVAIVYLMPTPLNNAFNTGISDCINYVDANTGQPVQNCNKVGGLAAGSVVTLGGVPYNSSSGVSSKITKVAFMNLNAPNGGIAYAILQCDSLKMSLDSKVLAENSSEPVIIKSFPSTVAFCSVSRDARLLETQDIVNPSNGASYTVIYQIQGRLMWQKTGGGTGGQTFSGSLSPLVFQYVNQQAPIVSAKLTGGLTNTSGTWSTNVAPPITTSATLPTCQPGIVYPGGACTTTATTTASTTTFTSIFRGSTTTTVTTVPPSITVNLQLLKTTVPMPGTSVRGVVNSNPYAGFSWITVLQEASINPPSFAGMTNAQGYYGFTVYSWSPVIAKGNYGTFTYPATYSIFVSGYEPRSYVSATTGKQVYPPNGMIILDSNSVSSGGVMNLSLDIAPPYEASIVRLGVLS